jgi:chemotaxis protein CheX
MTAPVHIPVSAEDLSSLAGDVFSALVGMELVEIGPDDPDARTAFTAVGSVSVSGSWDGSVTVAMTGGLPRAAAASMFMADDESLTSAEICDVVGELANMIGGNAKSLLPAPSRLSLPSVVIGAECSQRIPGGDLIASAVLACPLASGELAELHLGLWANDGEAAE